MSKLILSTLFFISIFSSYSQKKEIGKTFIKTLLLENNYKLSYNYLDESIKLKVSVSLLEETVLQLESQLGKFKSIIDSNNEKETYFFYSEFEKMKLDIKITFNEENKIIGFFFVPHKEFKKENSLGKELNIKSNNLELKGTLLTPENDSLKKLVIFIHGSGPNDRDETIFENKPFKDIAESLYKRGIASYRFDKKTLSNPEVFNDTSTIDDEVTNDILNIISYFKNDSQFSDYEIILLGHSLGAYLMPRIVNKSGSISKAIMLAGNARQLDELIIEQYNYLYKLNPSDEMKIEIKKLNNQVTLLNSKSFNLSMSKENLPLYLSAHYWKSILDYYPLKEVKKIKIPMLILQGERDYQVTIKDFELWKKSLKKNKQSFFINYPELNHFFMKSAKISSPEEYKIKGNVESIVIQDIYNFILK